MPADLPVPPRVRYTWTMPALVSVLVLAILGPDAVAAPMSPEADNDAIYAAIVAGDPAFTKPPASLDTRPDSGDAPSSVEVFRALGRAPEQPPALEAAPPVESCERATPAPAPSVAATRSPPPGFGLGGSTPPRQLVRGFFRRGSYFLGEFVPDDNSDDDDDAPSRFRGVTETAQPGAPPGPVRPKSDEES